MRAYLYIISVFISFASCKSVEKMVERGDFVQAFDYAISKLQGQKNKKTIHIEALEKAYFKLNAITKKEIDKLDPSSNPEKWSTAIELYESLDRRQNRIDPLLPLVSKNGYIGTFEIFDYRNAITEARENACLYHYNKGEALVVKAIETGQKVLARDAYYEFKKVKKYKLNYKDVDLYISKTLKLGLMTVYFDVYNGIRNYHDDRIEKHIWDLNVSKLNELWLDHKIGGFDEGKDADYVVLIELNNITIGADRETINNYTESKEIVVRKEKVQEVRDSIKVWVEQKVIEKVNADIQEVFREKKSELNGKIKVYDNIKKEYILSIPINVHEAFIGYSCKFMGDKRALTKKSKDKMDLYCEMFPSDFSIVDALSEAFKNTILVETRKVKFK